MTASMTTVMKLGGSVLKDTAVLKHFAQELSLKQKRGGPPVVLVHGGGPAINEELMRRSIGWSFVEGQRVTSIEIMEVVEEVLRDRVNSQIVRALSDVGLFAVGFSGLESSGATGPTLSCRPADPRLGLVGEITKVQTDLIESVLDCAKGSRKVAVPVVAPIAAGPEGQAFNINADWAAAAIAVALGSGTRSTRLVYVTDQDGILGRGGRAVRGTDEMGLHAMIEDGTVRGGMLTKTRAILHALEHGVSEVSVVNGLASTIFGARSGGTICRATSAALAAAGV